MAEATLAEAFAQHSAGRLDVAEGIYRAILAKEPANAAALHHLGLIAAANGRLDDADRLLTRSSELQPRNPDWLFNIGRLAALRGDLSRARALFERAAESEPGHVDAVIALGAVLLQLRQPAAARPWLAKAARLAPERPDLLTTRGLVEQEVGSAADAERLSREAVRHAPDWADAHSNLGYVLRRQGRTAEAEAASRAALALQPEHPDALVNIGLVRQSLKQPEEAIGYFERALRSRPDSADARYGLGTALVATGRVRDGRPVLEKLAAENPRNWNARWANLVGLPVVYESDEEIAAERRRFSDELARLEADVDPHLATDAAAMAAAVGLGTAFHLHYTGGDVRDLQERYGRLIGRIAAAAYPPFAAPRPLHRASAGRRLRVGFASSFLHHHSMMKTHGCWITDLPRDRFEVVVFQLGGPSDWRTEELKTATQWIDAAALDQPALLSRITGESLDAMIWPDIGMDPQVQVPAALRLAPVQAVGIGHPVTTGFAAIDAFLTSDAMEAADGERHYTEPLMRLPNLSVAYPWPRDAAGDTPTEMRRLRSQGPVFFCAQSLFKLIPEQDDVFARILADVPDATLVFISHGAAAVTEVVRNRLAARLRARRVAENRIVFLPRLSQGDFLAANRDADVVLDSFGWSGFNSTMEALAMGTPLVTCPGDTVRARHAFGVLKMAGLDELIARDADAYVALAARLGRDADLRQAMRERVRDRRERVFADRTAVAAFAEWIERAVRQREAR